MSYDRTIVDSHQLRFEPTHAAASRARQDLRRWLDTTGVPAPVATDMELIVSELTSNAVAQDPPAPIRLEVAVSRDAIRVTVANRPTSDRPPTTDRGPKPAHDVLADGGRGLSIVEALTDEMRVETADGWTSVTCLRRFEPPTA